MPRKEDILPNFLDLAVDAFHSLQGRDPKELAEYMEQVNDESDAETQIFRLAQQKRFDLFSAFGTHYLTDLVVGGKAIFTRTIDTESMARITGKSSGWAAGGGAKSKVLMHSVIESATPATG